jgi:hypothetical protein
MMPRHSIWRHIGKNIRRRSNCGQRSSGSQRSERSKGNGFWSSASDAVFFSPHKDAMLPIYRNAYRLDRQIKELERSLSQPAQASGADIGSWVQGKLLSAWHEFVDETKAVLTSLGFHLLNLVLIVVFNVIWFWLLIMLLGWWLTG